MCAILSKFLKNYYNWQFGTYQSYYIDIKHLKKENENFFNFKNALQNKNLKKYLKLHIEYSKEL